MYINCVEGKFQRPLNAVVRSGGVISGLSGGDTVEFGNAKFPILLEVVLVEYWL